MDHHVCLVQLIVLRVQPLIPVVIVKVDMCGLLLRIYVSLTVVLLDSIGIILQCIIFFIINNFSACTNCSANCLSCVTGTCSACSNGYYLNNAACVQCPSNCISCSTVNNCDVCASNYTWVQS